MVHPPRAAPDDAHPADEISFYTFQSMSYTIDVYRGVLAPLHSFKAFYLYIIFFPQLVAGPIVRASIFCRRCRGHARCIGASYARACG